MCTKPAEKVGTLASTVGVGLVGQLAKEVLSFPTEAATGLKHEGNEADAVCDLVVVLVVLLLLFGMGQLEAS